MVQWLRRHVARPKDPDYGRKVLDGYRMGLRAGGAVRGVRVLAAPDCCPECRIHAGMTYGLDDAPLLPIAACTHQHGCRCTYVAVMAYDQPGEPGQTVGSSAPL